MFVKPFAATAVATATAMQFGLGLAKPDIPQKGPRSTSPGYLSREQIGFGVGALGVIGGIGGSAYATNVAHSRAGLIASTGIGTGIVLGGISRVLYDD